MKMLTAIALLVDDEFANQMAALSLRCRAYGFNGRVLRLPSHVSLKQPFVVNDFERFEQYFEELAGRIEPQQLTFNGFSFWGNAEEGVVTANVIENTRLRQLHNQINSELEQAFGETEAEFDGDDYRFHLTVAIGACQADSLSQLQTDLAEWKLKGTSVSSRLAMFIYQELPQPDPLYGVREYGTYKVLPLRQKSAD